MNDEDIIEKLLVTLEGAANMMRGMQLDPSIPAGAKEALKVKMEEIDFITSDLSK